MACLDSEQLWRVTVEVNSSCFMNPLTEDIVVTGNGCFNNIRQRHSAAVRFGDGMAGARVVVYAVKPLEPP